ncbi:hypothetical protein [Burkholderia sp. Ac-20379]|uniref:hypothetical protein n=1 Tax=Burkholderia sp. Ac-20379 TaxID=2703900 RepID=UPI001F11A004|nr:hypothetical protein [Burkholderia sp. Ac-20379]
MRELPVLFSAPMVRAISEGRKTQTRRPMHPQPYLDAGRLAWMFAKNRGSWGPPGGAPDPAWLARCPYGAPGDRLWVRETFVAFGRWETHFSPKKGRDEWHFIDMTLEAGRAYRFDAPIQNARRDSITPSWWRRPAIHMPRAASRTQLEVISTRIEHLTSISDRDAEAEGCPTCPSCNDVGWINSGPDGGWQCKAPGCGDAPRDQYACLWDELNGPGSWAANPWVWVVEFKTYRHSALGQVVESAKERGINDMEQAQ